jgi:hypothetical protein
VASARRSDLRRYASLTRTQKAGKWLLDKTIRHGYQPLRGVGLLVAVYVAVLGVFWFAQHHGGVIVPAKETKTVTPAPTALHCSSAYPCFYPAGYAVDVVVPIVNLRQAEHGDRTGTPPGAGSTSRPGRAPTFLLAFLRTSSEPGGRETGGTPTEPKAEQRSPSSRRPEPNRWPDCDSDIAENRRKEERPHNQPPPHWVLIASPAIRSPPRG